MVTDGPVLTVVVVLAVQADKKRLRESGVIRETGEICFIKYDDKKVLLSQRDPGGNKTNFWLGHGWLDGRRQARFDAWY